MTFTVPRSRQGAALVNKVPLITATFWVIKILSTTVGETTSDYLAVNVGLGPLTTDGIVAVALAAALTVQFTRRQYTPWSYWLTVVLISISGTQITDFLTDTLGISLYASTAVFTVVLAVVFAIWHRQEMTLSITSINTRRREAFYWGAILVTFALGTAAGDLATEALSLGFRNGVLIFGGSFVVTLLARRSGAWPVLTFWAAYILTRPLGASVGDLLTQDHDFGGLGLGPVKTSLLFFAAILTLVTREQLLVRRHGVADKGDDTPPRRGEVVWATAATAAVLAAGGVLSLTGPASAVSSTTVGQSTLQQPTAAAGPAAGAPVAKPAAAPSKLGDLSTFSVIVTDVATLAQRGDLAGAKTRVKDLEVAWDSAEAGLKPRSPKDWNLLDGQIDDTLTTLRAGNPHQADCVNAVNTLSASLARLQGR